MKVVYIHQYFKTPSMAGGTRSYEMARRVAAAGHEVHMVTTSTDGSRPIGWTHEVVEGIHVHWLSLKYRNQMSYPRRMLAFLVFALVSGWRARRLRGDVVLATSTPITVVIPGLIATLGSRRAMVFEVRDLWPEIPIALGVLRNPVLRAMGTLLARIGYHHARVVIALSEDMAQGVRRAGYRGPIVVIPNGSDVDLFTVAKEEGEAFRQARPWLGDGPLVVYAGAFGKVNGVSYMVDLASESAKIGCEAVFLAVGEGAEWDLVRDYAREKGVLGSNFFIERAIPKANMPALLNAAAVCCSWVIPVIELESNSANKFFDALAAGRPVAVNYGGWQRALIEAKGIGVGLLAHDVRQSAEILRRFLADPDWLASAGRRSGEVAAKEFSRERLSQEFLSVLEGAVDASPPGSSDGVKGALRRALLCSD